MNYVLIHLFVFVSGVCVCSGAPSEVLNGELGRPLISAAVCAGEFHSRLLAYKSRVSRAFIYY